MHDDDLQKKCFDPLSGSRVRVSVKALLSYWCMLYSLTFDMQHDHFQKKNKKTFRPFDPILWIAGVCKGHYVCLQIVVCFIPFEMQHDHFKKKTF